MDNRAKIKYNLSKPFFCLPTVSMSLLKELEKFNLSPNEAKVYVACLELGPEAVQTIAARAKLNRVSAYSVIESLIAKGFLREEIIKNKRKVSAYPPMKLYDII